MTFNNIVALVILYMLARWVYWSHQRKTELRKALTVLKRAGYKVFVKAGCGWCKKELGELGDLADMLPFQDCDKYQQECSRLGINAFPTWVSGKEILSPGFKPVNAIIVLAQQELRR